MNANIEHFQGKLDRGVTEFNRNLTLSVGALYRRAVRTHLLSEGVRYREEKYFVDSDFIVYIRTRSDAKAYIELIHYIIEIQAEVMARNAVEKRDEAVKKNKFRKLTLRKPLPVPYGEMDDAQILRQARAQLHA